MKRLTNPLIAYACGLLLCAAWPVSPLTFLIFIAWVPLLWLESKVQSRKKFLGLTYITMFVWNVSTTWWIWNASAPGALAAFFPLYAIHHGMANPGLFFTVVALILISGRVSGGRILDLYNREKVILPCLMLCIISMGILAFSKSFPMFVLVAVVWGIGHAFLFPSLVAYAVDKMGSSRGPGMGTFTGFSDLGISLGPAIMGSVIHLGGYFIMFLCLALVGMLSLTYFYFFVREKE